MSDGYVKTYDWMLQHPKLTMVDAVLYGKIERLSMSKAKRCWAGNRHLADELGVCESSIKRSVRRLEKLGLVTVEITERKNRVITPIKNFTPDREGGEGQFDLGEGQFDLGEGQFDLGEGQFDLVNCVDNSLSPNKDGPISTHIFSEETSKETSKETSLIGIFLDKEKHSMDIGTVKDNTKDGKVSPPDPVRELAESWNRFATFCNSNFGTDLGGVKIGPEGKIAAYRTKAVQERLKSPDFNFKEILIRVGCSKFLLGLKSADFVVSFDWLTGRDLYYTKVLEGFYRSDHKREFFKALNAVIEKPPESPPGPKAEPKPAVTRKRTTLTLPPKDIPNPIDAREYFAQYGYKFFNTMDPELLSMMRRLREGTLTIEVDE